MMIAAKDLRKNLKTVPTTSGCYKWWAEKDELDFIMKIIDPNGIVNYSQIEMIKDPKSGKDLYCIYVGATGCYRNRFVEHFGLRSSSVLRRSIFALVMENKCGNVDTFIEKLYVSYPNGAQNQEKKLIQQSCRPLNDNYSPYRDIANKLNKLRKKYIPPKI